MCKFRAASAPNRRVRTDQPDEIGVLYKQPAGEYPE
jgi:hypothetical protein